VSSIRVIGFIVFSSGFFKRACGFFFGFAFCFFFGSIAVFIGVTNFLKKDDSVFIDFSFVGFVRDCFLSSLGPATPGLGAIVANLPTSTRCEQQRIATQVATFW